MKYEWFPAPIREPFLESTILQNGYVMIDVGANVGGWSLPASYYYRWVHAFEPNPNIWRVLERNIKTNKITNIMVHWKALGDARANGKPLYEYAISKRAHGSDSFLKEHMGYRTTGNIILVDVERLDTYMLAPDLIKIDTEGWEIPVLKGGEQMIRTYRPILVIETHLPDDDKRIIAMHPEYRFESIEQSGQIWLIGHHQRC